MAFQLPKPDRTSKICEPGTGIITLLFHRWLSRIVNRIEEQEARQDELIAALVAVNAATEAATAAAETATTAAASAQTAADDTTAQNNLTNSYPSTNPLSATDAGANATVTIAGHNRIYGDGTSVAITGGSLTGLAYSTEYFVYYDDATRAGGAVTFASTTSATTAAQTGDRHLVGSVTTPAAAAPPTTGEAVQPPGVGDLR